MQEVKLADHARHINHTIHTSVNKETLHLFPDEQECGVLQDAEELFVFMDFRERWTR